MSFQTKLSALRLGGIKRGWLVVVWLALAVTAPARPVLDVSDPVGYFTTVADTLLRTTFGFGVTNIPVYTNGTFVYTPAVQRLLQLSANIYDATTNHAAVCGRDYPSVFRPLFSTTPAGDLYITGYTNVASVTNASDPVLATPFDAMTVAAIGGTNAAVNIYGVPWIIGAKKGFPNFNQFYMLDVVQVTRKLQVIKPPPTIADPWPGLNEFLTNQMYIFSISNSVGCSLWNAYVSNYSGNLTILARDNLTMVLTNDALPAPGILNQFALPIFTTTLSNIWPGTVWAGSPPYPALDANNNSFIIPFNGTAVLLTNSIYRYAGYANAGSLPNGAPGFDPYYTDYQTNVLTPGLPHFGLLTTNRLQVAILDCDSNNLTHVIDYVQYAGPDSSRDLNAELADPSDPANINHYLWNTNPISSSNPNGTPWGVVNQIAISRGVVGPPNSGGYWVTPPNLPSYLPQTPAAEQAWFNGFYNVNRLQYGKFTFLAKIYTNLSSAVQAPYTPKRTMYSFTSWQANDPLVHFLVTDLNYSYPGRTGIYVSDDPISGFPLPQLTNVSKCWSPWGLYYLFSPSVDGAAFLTQMKDPLVWRPDDWNFPAGADWSISALGCIHRGTPWQTFYLKASDVLTNNTIATGLTGLGCWAQWMGDADYNDAKLSAPINDWRLLNVLVPLLNTNDPAQLIPVNASPAVWLNALDGLTVLTNSGADFNVYIANPPFDTYLMSGDSSQAASIASAIAQGRASQPGQNFQTMGDVLSVSALSVLSPWLNSSDTAQQEYALTDAAYEAIPAQLLSRLRPDSVGGVTLTNGAWNVRFSGSDIYNYLLLSSTDLIHWNVESTNAPVQGSFSAPISPGPDSPKRFYRSVQLP